MVNSSQVPEHPGTFRFTVDNRTHYADRIYFAKAGEQWDVVGLVGRGSELRGIFLTFYGAGTGSYGIESPGDADSNTARYIAAGNHSYASAGQLDVELTEEGRGEGRFYLSGTGANEVVGNFTLDGPPAKVLDQEVKALFEN